MLKHLVSGGMADVLLGRTDGIEGFERHVVLKRIRPEHAHDQRFIRMFLDEARVAANLHHQHIVQVHDVGEANGEYFIAMEYIHGEDVRTLLQTASKTRAHVPLGYAVMIVSAAAAGLHYAHERRGSDKRSLGIVHRDISPSNILVGYDGSIKVVDFGIAKAATRPETRGGLKGKVSYMSPEQCRSDEIDRRSDVYSLGVVLYELATTTRLFKGENDYLVMDQIVNGRVSLPRVRRPDLPNELCAIIMRALAPDPERRYFTAEELRVALDHFASKAGLTASPSSLAAYMRKQFGDRPEPWLELKGPGIASLDDVQTANGEGTAQSWSELPRSDDARRSGPITRPSGLSGMIARQSEPSGAMRAAAAEPIEAGAQRDSARNISSERSRITPSPTDAKMGWESQQPPSAPRRAITPAKVAMISAPLIVLLGIAVWRLAGMGTTTSPVAAVATQPSAAVVPAPPPPTVTPIPVPPPAPAPQLAATEPAAAPKAAAKAPEPAPSKKSPPSSGKKASGASAAKTTETSSSPAKSEAAPPASSATGATPAAPTPPPGAVASAPASGSSATRLSQPAPPSTTAGGSGPATPPAPSATSAAITTLLPPPASATPAAAPAPTASPVATPAVATSVPAPPPVAPVAEGPAQLAHTVVEHVASGHLKELSKCDSESLHGEIIVKFSVESNGKVSKAQLASAIKKYKLAACILRSVQKWQFPKQGPGGATGTYTLSFQ